MGNENRVTGAAAFGTGDRRQRMTRDLRIGSYRFGGDSWGL